MFRHPVYACGKHMHVRTYFQAVPANRRFFSTNQSKIATLCVAFWLEIFLFKIENACVKKLKQLYVLNVSWIHNVSIQENVSSCLFWSHFWPLLNWVLFWDIWGNCSSLMPHNYNQDKVCLIHLNSLCKAQNEKHMQIYYRFKKLLYQNISIKRKP